MQNVFEMLDLNQLLTQTVAWLPALAVAILILLAFWAAFRMTRKPLRGILVTAGLEQVLADMLVIVYRVTLLAFGGVLAASQLGIDVGAALAGLGVVGLTIGFAAKDSLSNIIAGFLIFWDSPFTEGDWITVAGEYGRVTRITMRTTRIRTLNNTYVVIPNQTIGRRRPGDRRFDGYRGAGGVAK
jgi:small conductance mechanosensitive channel